MKNLFIALLVILVLVIGSYALYVTQNLQQEKTHQMQMVEGEKTVRAKYQKEIADMREKEAMAMKAKELTIALSEINNSGQSGTATIKEENGKVDVKIMIKGLNSTSVHPAYIHAGKCPGVGAIKYPLKNVVNGESETYMNATIDGLKKALPLAINVNTACGDIAFPSSSTVSQ